MTDHIILFDDPVIRKQLLPFTYTRPVCDIRIGIRTIREKWIDTVGVKTCTLTQDYLKKKFPAEASLDNMFINGALLPDEALLQALDALKPGEGIAKNGYLLAGRVKGEDIALDPIEQIIAELDVKPYEGDFCLVENLYDIYLYNGGAIEADFKAMTAGQESAPIDENSKAIDPENIFIHPTAKVSCAVLNASTGPIYIGPEAEVMEGVLVRGPLALCEGATLKMGAQVYGATTIGPHSKLGGEINNSVIFGYTNKAHGGFLGNSVLGEWCNLGADTNNSNLKNNYGEVKLWNYATKINEPTGKQFVGLFMGDHSKSGINTMFNTGTVAGVFANVFGGDFPEKFIPSYAWGGADGFTTYHLNKAFEVAEKVMARRGLELTDEDKSILSHIYEITREYRKK